ncbi:MAG: DUF4340 domain-containing protein, partial [Spirochaetia bacterium]|nr:DUF4340 domain-containing protein [Spirochaetia bacterium]
FTTIIILGLYLIFNNTGKMNYTIPKFSPLETQTITYIEIKSLADTIKLYSDNGVWKITPSNLRIEPSKVAEMLLFLENPDFIDMVSDTNNYQNYGLDEGEFINITANTEKNNIKNPIRELYIGDLNVSSKFAFIRRADNNSVFTTGANIKKLFDTTEKDLIDKTILDIDTNKIDKIELIEKEKKNTINKSVDSDNKDVWKTVSGLTLDTKAMDQSLRYLVNSRFDSYTETAGNNTNSNIFTITLYEGDRAHNLSIMTKGEKSYTGNSTFAGKDFVLSENTGTQIIKMFGDQIN